MELYPVCDKVVQEIWKIHNVTRESIDEKIVLLQEWIKTQPHLPQEMPYGNFLDKMLLINKFDLEATKEKIDKHFSLKSKYTSFYECLTNGEWILPSKCGSGYYPLPKLGPGGERIVVMNEKTPDPKNYNFEKILFVSMVLIELSLRFDYPMTTRLIFDCKNTGFGIVPKVNFRKFKQGASIMLGVYASRVASIEILNAPSFVSIFINAIKFVINPKMLDRMHFHDNLESLHKNIPPEYLPIELGGTEGSVEDLTPLLDKAFEEHRDFITRIMHFKTDESLRPKKEKKSRKSKKSQRK